MAEDPAERLARADRFLATTSWDRTWSAMARLIDGVVEDRPGRAAPAARLAGASGR